MEQTSAANDHSERRAARANYRRRNPDFCGDPAVLDLHIHRPAGQTRRESNAWKSVARSLERRFWVQATVHHVNPFDFGAPGNARHARGVLLVGFAAGPNGYSRAL